MIAQDGLVQWVGRQQGEGERERERERERKDRRQKKTEKKRLKRLSDIEPN